MSFSDAEKDAIAGYMGISADTEEINRLNDAIAKVELVASAETRVKAILTKLAAIETQIDTARNSVGSAYSQLLSEAQRQVYLIGNTLGIKVERKVF